MKSTAERQKKYLVIGGRIRSEADNHLHVLTPLQLCELYEVSPPECVLVDPDASWQEVAALRRKHRGLIVLLPRDSGQYAIPEEAGK